MWSSVMLFGSKMEDDMSVDLWTKIALTIIAASLAVIAWKLPFTDYWACSNGNVREQ
jgi:hypothetical protein